MKRNIFGLIVILLLSMPAAAQIQTVWKDARFLKQPMKKILVLSQFFDPGLRDEVTENFTTALADKGIRAVPAYDVLSYDSLFFYSTMERLLDSAGVDGIMVIKMIDIKNTDVYIMPQEMIPPYAYNYYEYYSFYYYHDLPIISDPNYYRRPGIAFRIDVNLYQNRGDMIVWSGKSKELNPLDPEKAIKSLGKKTAKILLSEDLVVKSNQ
jgi:hypothetical protein